MAAEMQGFLFDRMLIKSSQDISTIVVGYTFFVVEKNSSQIIIIIIVFDLQTAKKSQTSGRL